MAEVRRPHLALAALVAAGLLLLTTACGGQEQQPAEGADAEFRPSVVVTKNIHADVIATAFGDLIEVVDVMPAGVDPHSFELSARGAQSLDEADLIVVNGLNLEENVLPLVAGAADRGRPILELAPELDPIVYTDDADPSEVGLPDPHVWTDVSRMVAVPGLVADALLEVVDHDEAWAAAINDAAEAAAEELRALDLEVEQILADLPEERRVLVTNHHVFGYFAERYSFRVLGSVIPGATTLASPSAADFADLVATIDEAGVPVLFSDASSPTQLAEAVARTTQIELEIVSLWTESLAPPGEGAETYREMMRDNASRIAQALAP